MIGGLQDNSSWMGDSAYPGGISNGRWENMYGGDGFWAFADPADPAYIYAEAQGGTIGRVNRYTHETRTIQPEANYNEKLRWNWNTPIALSPNEKGTIYIGAQFLFRSRDHGQSWDRISPDLTTNDKNKQKQEESGGVTIDNSAAETHTTIYSISESPKQAGTIWVGTDDGNVQLTRDGGKSWTNVVGNIKGVPANAWVSWVQAGNFDAGTAFVAFDRHTFGDMAPYIYRTSDYGKTWTALVTPKDALRERFVETRVRFKRLSRDEIERYLASGEWRGKAGGYAIQGLAGTFVVKLTGSYTNVVGLPLYETVSLLDGEGYPVRFTWLNAA